MSRIVWDALGKHRYEIGVDRGVFYPLVGPDFTDGVPWDGLTGVDDDIGGREATVLYSRDVKVAAEYTPEEYSGKIKCFTYPDEFEEFLGETEIGPGIYARQQSRDLFGFSYRSMIGNDTEGREHGYKIHLIYNMRVTEFSRSYTTINESMEVGETEISFETFPQRSSDPAYEPISEITLDSRTTDPDVLARLENILYGTVNDSPRLPYPDEILEMFVPEQPIPEDWYLFPNDLIYPANNLYPYNRNN